MKCFMKRRKMHINTNPTLKVENKNKKYHSGWCKQKLLGSIYLLSVNVI